MGPRFRSISPTTALDVSRYSVLSYFTLLHSVRQLPFLLCLLIRTTSIPSTQQFESKNSTHHNALSNHSSLNHSSFDSYLPRQTVQSFQSAATTQYSRRYSLFDLQLLRTNTFSNLPIVSQRCNSQRLLFWPFAPHLLLHTLPPSVPSPSIISMAGSSCRGPHGPHCQSWCCVRPCSRRPRW